MSKSASYAIGVVVVILLAGVGMYLYTTAPTKAPSVVVNEETPTVATGTVTNQNVMVAPPLPDGKYRIISEQSTASFSLEEDLRGKRVTVLGTTNQVSGAIKADPANLMAIEFDPIRINARTFVTDSEQRNNAIRRMILKTENDANEFIEFLPKSLIGAPASSTIGQIFPFKVKGDLKVSGTTKEVTFEGTVVFNSLNQLSGTAQTKVNYSGFGLAVPNLPFLANVDEDVTLKLDFVAKK